MAVAEVPLRFIGPSSETKRAPMDAKSPVISTTPVP
jgi:hypothetical protein